VDQSVLNVAGLSGDQDQIIAAPRMPATFQNRRIKAFSLGHEHTLALDRRGPVASFITV